MPPASQNSRDSSIKVRSSRKKIPESVNEKPISKKINHLA